MIFAIDFDEVLHNPHALMKGHKLGVPYPDAVATMKRWHDEGHTLVIFTVRGGERRSIQAAADWLDYFGIPYDSITNIKPDADMFLDNHAHQYTTWDEVSRYVTVMWPEPETPTEPVIALDPVEW